MATGRVPPSLPKTPIGEAFYSMAVERDDHPVMLGAGSRCLTYAALRREVEKRVSYCHSQGVRPGDLVVSFNKDPFEFVINLLALALLNARVMPLDSTLAPTAQRELLRLSAARFLNDGGSDLVSLDQLARPSIVQQAAEENHYLLLPTSASTGQPKLVVRTQNAMLAEGTAYVRSLPIVSSDRMLVMPPLHHAFGVGLCVFSFLIAGCSLVILDHFAPRVAMYAAEETGATLIPGVPYMFDLILRTPLKRAISLNHLRICLAGAGPLSQKTFTQFQERFGHPIHSTFGSTETGAATWVPSADFRPGRVGRSLWGVKLELRDSGNATQSDVANQLFIHSPAMMRGYLVGDELDTAQMKDGWFSTNDLAHIDGDGDLYLDGRTAHTINIAGKKVNPVEVETVLSNHPEVNDVAVLGVTDSEGITRLAALVVANQPIDASILISYCSERLSPYQVPRFVKFCPSLYRNKAGKIVRQALHQLWNPDDTV